MAETAKQGRGKKKLVIKPDKFQNIPDDYGKYGYRHDALYIRHDAMRFRHDDIKISPSRCRFLNL